MKANLYQIDAFTDTLFGGNPAAVCPLKKWLDKPLLQKIAAENYRAETAFIVPKNKYYEIRWFTPTVEVDLGGHTTLAAGYTIFKYLKNKKTEIHLKSKHHNLTVRHEKNDFITLDFPMVPIIKDLSKNYIGKALGIMPEEIWKGIDYVAVLGNEDLVRKCKPNFELINKLVARGIAITSKGKSADFVSRFFGPQVGVDEDYVNGSSHCYLAPYWAKRLNKTKLYAEQLSKRIGQIHCEVKDNRVFLSGQAVPYLIGEISIPVD